MLRRWRQRRDELCFCPGLSLVQITCEAPDSPRGNILQVLSEVGEPAERGRTIDQGVDGSDKIRLLYYLCASFHAAVQQRLKYVPIGWSSLYEFPLADAVAACRVAYSLAVRHAGEDTVPQRPKSVTPDVYAADAARLQGKGTLVETLKGIMREAIYGARIDRPVDIQALNCCLEDTFSLPWDRRAPHELDDSRIREELGFPANVERSVPLTPLVTKKMKAWWGA